MFKKLAFLALISLFVTGCASVPMQSTEVTTASITAAQSPAPEGKSNLFIFRDSGLGTALRKDLWVNGECLGATAPKVFFTQQVPAGKAVTVSTQSEFSPNHLTFQAESGKNYFIEQYIRMGVFVGGANLRLIDEQEGLRRISSLGLAERADCRSKFSSDN
jgi:hypothetical protein